MYYHKGRVYEIIELKNRQLASCSEDKSIIIYFKDKNEYEIDYKIKTNNDCISVIQTKNNEIVYCELLYRWNHKFCFYDLLEKK